MPRTEIDLQQTISYLSILDEEGNADEELVPDLDDDTLHRLFRVMLLSRRFDERLLQLQRQGRLGTFAPVKGQEAAQIGAMAPLRRTDWFVPSFRETAAALWRDTPLSGLLLYNAGFNEGGLPPEGNNDLPIAIPVATQVPHAVGLGYAARAQGKDDVAIVFFGDGATSEGDFHEAINFSGVFSTPTIFLCQNNQWAISVPREKQTHSRTLAQKAIAYGIPGIQVDGNDVLAVYAATVEAVERARAGEGPTFIECITYRLSLHTTADDPSRYRSEEEVQTWERKEPLIRFRRYLESRGLLSDQEVERLEQEIKEEIEQAWQEAQVQMENPDPSVMFEHIYADPPDYLQAQRAAFQKEIGGG
ncbi:pyruvate dehydrogenase (acetyl-transferring) E1 component subunit alpha [Thiohalomonas denitrificans]|uniref:Pyruvate dehydrogenase E1 component subunit alpha n=1 Tax=Thiohalomonas denitrificans TaxID=415747 RepID=A0A1G5Q839_9GAMM|nr:pyruvate dehydrogenase (acetyl-transferring) E1 component subunit alpha [Thiohalomonas denitrificans]SCZ57630.1 pyruvate dehydrogenase E1 component alpha subunit [Thiohalomonas denitrificans]